MIGDSLSSLKQACYAALTGTSAFMALVTGVCDAQAPTNQAFNYVVMGKGTQIPKNTLGKGGRECTIEFEVYTQGTIGSQKASGIVDQLIRTLAQSSLTLVTTPAQVCVFVDLDHYSDEIMVGSSNSPTMVAIARLLFRTQEV